MTRQPKPNPVSPSRVSSSLISRSQASLNQTRPSKSEPNKLVKLKQRKAEKPPNRKSSEQRRPPTIAVIGAGRLGTALARALAKCGYSVVALVCRDARHAQRAARLVDPKPLALTSAQLHLLPPSDLLLLTTPDDVISDLAQHLAATGATEVNQQRIALHASGALSSDALAPLRQRGWRIGSLHPLLSISDPVAGAASLAQAFYCVEGDKPAVRAAQRLVRDLGGQSFTLNPRDKALYHLAAVIASGHVVALFDIAAELLVSCGLSQGNACRILVPLLGSTLKNLSTQKPARALTGTFARADVATVHKHLAALSQHRQQGGDRDATDVYRVLGRHALRLAAENNVDARALKKIKRALDSSMR